jgi:hypothetical protein
MVVARCYTQRRIDVDPAQEPAESLAHLALVVDELGSRLPQNPDGSCAHVTPHGCGVYDHRPAPCRRYDCRFFSLAAISVPPAPGGQTEPRWLFSPGTPEDFALLTLAEVGAARFAAEQGGKEWRGEDALKAALQYAPPRLSEQTARTAALRAPPAAKRQTLAQSLSRSLRKAEQRGRQ